MADRPLLILPRPLSSERRQRPPAIIVPPKLPSPARQATRLAPQFAALVHNQATCWGMAEGDILAMTAKIVALFPKMFLASALGIFEQMGDQAAIAGNLHNL